MKAYFSRMKGQGHKATSHPKTAIVWSWFAAFIGIYSISLFSEYVHLVNYDQLFLVGSFGASAVLIYGTPHVEYSQPRNLVGGHIVSAFIGITIYKLFPSDVALASALAVSLSIAAMHLLKVIHPPGGATALIAVIGSSEIHDMGYQYILSPIGTGILIMLVVALGVNNLSGDPARHYPKRWL